MRISWFGLRSAADDNDEDAFLGRAGGGGRRGTTIIKLTISQESVPDPP